MGWIGESKSILRALEAAGADKDETGRYLLYGALPARFMGSADETAVPTETEYSIQGARHNLTALLLRRGASGLCINII